MCKELEETSEGFWSERTDIVEEAAGAPDGNGRGSWRELVRTRTSCSEGCSVQVFQSQGFIKIFDIFTHEKLSLLKSQLKNAFYFGRNFMVT